MERAEEDGGGSSLVTLQAPGALISHVEEPLEKKRNSYVHDTFNIQNSLCKWCLWRWTDCCDGHIVQLVLQPLFLVPNLARVVDRRKAIHLLSLAIEINTKHASVRARSKLDVDSRSCVPRWDGRRWQFGMRIEDSPLNGYDKTLPTPVVRLADVAFASPGHTGAVSVQLPV
jgi:hypothetical protein